MTARRTLAKMRSRRRALVKLGGACACRGAGPEFLPVLEFHHVRGNGELHRRVLRALDTGIVGWIMDCPDPWRVLRLGGRAAGKPRQFSLHSTAYIAPPPAHSA